MTNLMKIYDAIRAVYGDDIMEIASRVECPKARAKWILTVIRGGRVVIPAK